MGYDTYKPDWTPECAGDEFACQVMTGIDEEALRKAKAKAVPAIRRRELSVDEYVKGILPATG